MYSACELGDSELLKIAISEDTSILKDEDVTEALNQINHEGLTLLQSSAGHSFKDIVW